MSAQQVRNQKKSGHLIFRIIDTKIRKFYDIYIKIFEGDSTTKRHLNAG